jgi:imidazolonepropionase-like amidohydrolase
MNMVILENGRLFDGIHDDLAEPCHVLVEDDRIREVAREPISVQDARRIDCRGQTVMPGLIDAHVHACLPTSDFDAVAHMRPSLLSQYAGVALAGYLRRGFATVREELRKGAAQIKIFASGGVTSPADPIWMRSPIRPCITGLAMGLKAANLEKLEGIMGKMYRSLEVCRRYGVKFGFGTDLPGNFGERQNQEFRLRAAVQPAIEILRSATAVNAELLGMEGEIGCVRPGAYADLLVVNGDPTCGISVLAEPATGLSLIMSRGSLVKNILPS